MTFTSNDDVTILADYFSLPQDHVLLHKDLSSSVTWLTTDSSHHRVLSGHGGREGSAAGGEEGRYVVNVILVGLLLSAFIVFAVAGNILVIVAILTDRHLRKTSNYFLVSLAVADALVASIVMTFAVVNDVMQQWPFGHVFCNVWQSADIMCSTASILHLSAVSLDRYINIRQPLHYDRLVTQRRSLLAIAFIWIMSALLSFLPIHLGWHELGSDNSNSKENAFPTIIIQNDSKTSRILFNESVTTNHTAAVMARTVYENSDCLLELNMWYAIISSILSFYAPCVVMISLYWKLYRYAMKHVKRINESLGASSGSVKCTRSTDSLAVKSLLATVQREDSLRSWQIVVDANLDADANRSRTSSVVSKDRHLFEKSHTLAGSSREIIVPVGDVIPITQNHLNTNTMTVDSVADICSKRDRPVKRRSLYTLFTEHHRRLSSKRKLQQDDIEGLPPRTAIRNSLCDVVATPRSTPPPFSGTSGRPSVSYRRQSDHKAAVTLGIIMGVFLVCWMPFFTMNVVGAFYHDIPPMMFSVFTWLGYLNSTMNPVIYGVFNQEFRRAFKNVLASCCYYNRCFTRRSNNREYASRSSRSMKLTNSSLRGGSVNAQASNNAHGNKNGK